MLPLVTAILVLQPVLDEAGPLRLASTGTGDEPVVWKLDGVVVAETSDAVAATIQAPAGAHTLVAETPHAGAWSVLARTEPGVAGIEYVPAWSAHSEGLPVGVQAEHGGQPLLLGGFAAAGALGLLLAWKRRVHVRPIRRKKVSRATQGAEEACILEM